MNINAGCGPIRYDGFVNVDINPAHQPDVCQGIIEYLGSLEPDTVDCIITIHMLEHLAYPFDTIGFLSLSRRALKPEGVLRIVVPDAMKVAADYIYGEDDLKSVYGPGKFYYYKDCAVERFVYFMREWEHTIVFDEELLRLLAEDAGFSVVRRMPFGSSDIPALHGLDRFESESLSLECVK